MRPGAIPELHNHARGCGLRDDVIEVYSKDEMNSETLHLSQAVMVRRLRTNDRTYQNWEQGKSKPNAQAALLIKLVEKHPETFEHLAAL